MNLPLSSHSSLFHYYSNLCTFSNLHIALELMEYVQPHIQTLRLPWAPLGASLLKRIWTRTPACLQGHAGYSCPAGVHIRNHSLHHPQVTAQTSSTLGRCRKCHGFKKSLVPQRANTSCNNTHPKQSFQGPRRDHVRITRVYSGKPKATESISSPAQSSGSFPICGACLS